MTPHSTVNGWNPALYRDIALEFIVDLPRTSPTWPTTNGDDALLLELLDLIRVRLDLDPQTKSARQLVAVCLAYIGPTILQTYLQRQGDSP